MADATLEFMLMAERAFAQRDKLASLLRKARPHVAASNEAEHLMDGFGPRSSQPSDKLLAEIDAAVTAIQRGIDPE